MSSPRTPRGHSAPEEQERHRRLFEQAIDEASDGQQAVHLSLHPLALAGIGFVILGCWFWAFGMGAIVLGGISLIEIRRHGKHRGTALSLVVIAGGLIGGTFSACVRTGRIHKLITSSSTAEECITNLSAIRGALQQYSQNYDGHYPDELRKLYPTYIEDASILRCPAVASDEEHTGYIYHPPDAPDPDPKTVIVLDSAPRHRNGTGGLALRQNDKISWLPAKDLQMKIMKLENK